MANTLIEIFPEGYVHIVGYSGIYTGSQGTSALDLSSINTVPLDTTANVSPSYNTYYKLQGFNPLTGQYEDWHSMNEPLFDPPSGNALLNISIVYSWVDR